MAMERPKYAVVNATPKHKAITTKRNNSSLSVAAILLKILGTIHRLNIIATTTNRAILAKAKPSATAIFSGCCKAGSIANITPKAKSWVINIASIICPCTVLVSPLSVSVFNTIAVEERDKTAPKKIPWGIPEAQPVKTVTIATRAIVNPICSKLPLIAISLTRFRSAKENSTPSANSRKATPISAKDLMSATLLNNLKPKGPIAKPLTK